MTRQRKLVVTGVIIRSLPINQAGSLSWVIECEPEYETGPTTRTFATRKKPPIIEPEDFIRLHAQFTVGSKVIIDGYLSMQPESHNGLPVAHPNIEGSILWSPVCVVDAIQLASTVIDYIALKNAGTIEAQATAAASQRHAPVPVPEAKPVKAVQGNTPKQAVASTITRPPEAIRLRQQAAPLPEWVSGRQHE